MRNRWSILSIIVTSVLLASLVISCCDDDNPVKPPPAKDYYVYFSDYMAPNTFYRYDTGTKEVDSFYLPYNAVLDGFGISPDGKKMYLHPDEGIVEVELDSFTVIAEHPLILKRELNTWGVHEVLASPDGHYLALVNRFLYIIDLTDFSVAYADSVNRAGHGWFTEDSRNFLCSINDTVDNYNHVYVLEVAFGDTISAVRHEFPIGYPVEVVASPDYRKWIMFMYLGNDIHRFQVYDRELDSIIFHTDFCPGGDMVISPDGREVVYSYAKSGYVRPICVPKGYITLFDVVGNRPNGDVYNFIDSLLMVGPIGDMVITPDNRSLIAVPIALGQIFHYDLGRREVVTRLQFGDANILTPPVCQRKP
jgi:hypothetical protein